MGNIFDCNSLICQLKWSINTSKDVEFYDEHNDIGKYMSNWLIGEDDFANGGLNYPKGALRKRPYGTH